MLLNIIHQTSLYLGTTASFLFVATRRRISQRGPAAISDVIPISSVDDEIGYMDDEVASAQELIQSSISDSQEQDNRPVPRILYVSLLIMAATATFIGLRSRIIQVQPSHSSSSSSSIPCPPSHGKRLFA